MRNLYKQFIRFRKVTLDELGVRGRQELMKLGERLLQLKGNEMTDRAFIRHIERAHRRQSAHATASGILDRIRKPIDSSLIIPSFLHRNEIVVLMQERYERESRAIISRANRAIEGRFDLLGFDELDFGAPPDWLLEPVSGKRAPLKHWTRIDYLDAAAVGDKKITWELNRHQHFVTLAQAYWLTGDERYAKAFVAQAGSWMDANPPKRGINWVSSLELSLRSISWLWAVHMFSGSPSLPDEFALRLLKHLVLQGLHIEAYLSHYFSPNTHLTGEALGLFYLGSALPALRCAKRWRTLGLEILLRELPRQVRTDGVYFEQATAYHRYTADFYIHLLVLARASGTRLPVEVERVLSQLVTHLSWIIRPDGSTPLIGDEDSGRLLVLNAREPDDFRDTVGIAAALFGRGDWKHAAGECPIELLWLLGPEEVRRYDELHREEPRASSRVFQAGGYAVLRDGWSRRATYALMDCGPHGSLSCGHAHADSLSIEFAAMGRTWIVDPGTFTYTGDNTLRDWFRSTAAHSTATVDGISQSIPAGPFSWTHIAKTTLAECVIEPGFDYIEAWHDGYQRLVDPVRHTRRLIFPQTDHAELSLPSYLVVRDSFSATLSHTYSIRYQLAPGCTAVASGNSITVTGLDGASLVIAGFGQSSICACIEEGWVSRGYGKREPAPAVVFEFNGDGPQHFTTFIAPDADDRSLRIERERLAGELNVPMQEVATDAVAQGEGFQIYSNQCRDVLLFAHNGAPFRCGPLTAGGSLAWARFAGNEFSRAVLMQGWMLETDDGFRFRSVERVHHCGIQRAIDRIECSINGAAPFFLSLGHGPLDVLIDGSSIEMYRSGFSGESSNHEAIN